MMKCRPISHLYCIQIGWKQFSLKESALTHWFHSLKASISFMPWLSLPLHPALPLTERTSLQSHPFEEVGFKVTRVTPSVRSQSHPIPKVVLKIRYTEEIYSECIKRMIFVSQDLSSQNMLSQCLDILIVKILEPRDLHKPSSE